MKGKRFLLIVTICMLAVFAAGCASKDTSSMTGVLEEKKDFMFILVDEENRAFAFSFDKTPKGLDQVKAGDKVTVTYTGEITEVDPFKGEVLSVEKAE